MPEKTVVKLVVALVLCILLIIFAIQNFGQECRVKLLFWTIGRWPVSIIIFISILVGVLIAVCEILPHVLQLRKRARDAEDALARLKASRGGTSPGDTQPWAGDRGKRHT